MASGHPDVPNVMTVTAAAKAWGVSTATVKRWCSQNRVPATKAGRIWLIPLHATPPYIKSNH